MVAKAGAIGGMAGAWAGAAVGAKGGAAVGGTIGVFFFGAGAAPGAAIGVFVGGLGGGIAGGYYVSETAKKLVRYKFNDMDKIIYYWNMVHYYLFIWQVASYKLLEYINPFTYLFKINRVKKFYSKHGVDNMNKFTDRKIFNAQDHGLNIVWAGINLSGLIIIFEYGLFNIIQSCLGRYIIQDIWEDSVYKISFVMILLIIPAIINYLLVFKEERYLSYFNMFKKMDSNQRIKYGWLCCIFSFLVFMFFILSFYNLSLRSS